jgi:hypothetical protein
MTDVQEAVAALGYRCIISPNDLNPPCVLVGVPTTVQSAHLAGDSLQAQLPVQIIGRGLLIHDMQWITDTMDALMAALPFTSASPVVYRLTDGKELPAYTLTLEGTT